MPPVEFWFIRPNQNYGWTVYKPCMIFFAYCFQWLYFTRNSLLCKIFRSPFFLIDICGHFVVVDIRFFQHVLIRISARILRRIFAMLARHSIGLNQCSNCCSIILISFLNQYVVEYCCRGRKYGTCSNANYCQCFRYNLCFLRTSNLLQCSFLRVRVIFLVLSPH